MTDIHLLSTQLYIPVTIPIYSTLHCKVYSVKYKN